MNNELRMMNDVLSFRTRFGIYTSSTTRVFHSAWILKQVQDDAGREGSK